MTKFLKFLFLTIIFSQLSWASDKVIKFEDFIHFSKEQKLETLKLVHSYLVQYEQLNIQAAKKARSKKKYQSYIKIFNFLINSAYADSSEQFSRASLKSGELCFYAGWISVRVVQNNQSICTHPKRLKSLLEKRSSFISPENKALMSKVSRNYIASTTKKPVTLKVNNSGQFSFQSSSTKACNSSGSDIICNPTFFGYKSGSSICVEGNSNLGLNSSLLCNQALNLIEEQNPEEYQVTIQGILNNATGKNQTEFFHILDTMYDTCLCGKDANGPGNGGRFQGSIDARYAEVMFNQRACFGIINQTEHIQTALQAQPADSPTCSAFEERILNDNNEGINWLNYLNKAYQKLQEQGIDTKISQVIELRKASLNSAISESQRNKLRSDEAELISSMRDQHFEDYIEAGLCPGPSGDQLVSGGSDENGASNTENGRDTASDSDDQGSSNDNSESNSTDDVNADGTEVSTTNPDDSSGTGTDTNATDSNTPVETEGTRTTDTGSETGNGSDLVIVGSTDTPENVNSTDGPGEVGSNSDPIGAGGGSGSSILTDSDPIGLSGVITPLEVDVPSIGVPDGYSLSIEKSGVDNDQNIAMLIVTLTHKGENSPDEFKNVLNSIGLDVERSDDQAETEAVEHDFRKFDPDNGDSNIAQGEGSSNQSQARITFRGTKKPYPITIFAVGTFNNNDIRSEGSVTIEASGADGESEASTDDETADSSNNSCRVSIAKENDGDNLIKLTANIQVKGVDGKFQSPSESSNATIIWYKSSSTPAASAPKARPRNTLADDGAEEAQTDDKMGNLTMITETQVPADSKEGQFVDYAVVKPTEDITYGVKISIPEVCEATNKVEIKGSGGPTPANNAPYQLRPQGGGHAPAGGILGGQR